MTTESIDITIRVPSNADNATIAAALRMRAGLFEGLSAKQAASRKNTDANDDFEKAEEEVVAQESFDLDSETETETETLEDDFMSEEKETTAAKKAAKAKKVTIEEVNAACKARARAGGKDGRKQVLAILKKQFKTESITEIAQNEYANVIKAMAVKGETK
jgi:hypothetical protein